MLHISAVKSSSIIYSQYSINQIIAESFMNNATTWRIFLTGKVRVIQNICDMACHENQKFWGIFFHTHMGTS